ncbi:MAG: hypothetical protein ACLFU4_04820 [Opitutales bacterium]
MTTSTQIELGRFRPPCPHLPPVDQPMNHCCLTGLPRNSPAFYLAAQRYGNFLWQRGHAGRAILALTRSLYTDLAPDDPIYPKWPLPYAALGWILLRHPRDDFPGNPRISFQHQATRLRGPNADCHRARAWAVWALVRRSKPQLPGDARDPVPEPTPDEIEQGLEAHGHPGEAKLWRKIQG